MDARCNMIMVTLSAGWAGTRVITWHGGGQLLREVGLAAGGDEVLLRGRDGHGYEPAGGS